MPASVLPAAKILPPQCGDDPSIALERRISLIVHRVSARFSQIANKLLSTQGINMYESRILLFLLQRGEMRVGELVDAMALPQSTMSHQLKQLQARRLIRRRRSRKDNRAVSVMMTPAGEEIARNCERYSVHVQRKLLRHFTAKKMDELTSQLEAVFEFLDVSRFSPEEVMATAPSETMTQSRKRAIRRRPSRAEAM